MPHFHLHQIYDGERIADLEGAEFEDLAAALQEAIEAARELCADRIRRGKTLDNLYFEICDAADRMMLRISFREAIANRSSRRDASNLR